MTDQMVLDLVDKKLETDQIVLTVGYDIENLNNADRRKQYHGEVTIDRYKLLIHQIQNHLVRHLFND